MQLSAIGIIADVLWYEIKHDFLDNKSFQRIKTHIIENPVKWVDNCNGKVTRIMEFGDDKEFYKKATNLEKQ